MAGWYFFWVYWVGLLGGGAIAGGVCWGCFASAFCMCLSLVGLSYRGDSCIRLVDLLDLLSIDRLSVTSNTVSIGLATKYLCNGWMS